MERQSEMAVALPAAFNKIKQGELWRATIANSRDTYPLANSACAEPQGHVPPAEQRMRRAIHLHSTPPTNQVLPHSIVSHRWVFKELLVSGAPIEASKKS